MSKRSHSPDPPTEKPTGKAPKPVNSSGRWSVHPVVDAFVSMPADSRVQAWDDEKWVTLGPIAKAPEER